MNHDHPPYEEHRVSLRLALQQRDPRWDIHGVTVLPDQGVYYYTSGMTGHGAPEMMIASDDPDDEPMLLMIISALCRLILDGPRPGCVPPRTRLTVHGDDSSAHGDDAPAHVDVTLHKIEDPDMLILARMRYSDAPLNAYEITPALEFPDMEPG